jgi:hypothetical protein
MLEVYLPLMKSCLFTFMPTISSLTPATVPTLMCLLKAHDAAALETPASYGRQKGGLAKLWTEKRE